MEFRLLGVVTLTVDGAPIDLGPPRQRAVLAALLVDAGQPVSVETLVARVWGESPPPEVRNALYSHIARIRRLLGSTGGTATIDRYSGGYVLRVDPERVDLLRHQNLVAQARASTGVLAERAGQLREALALWHGEPLTGVTGDWADQTREALERQRLTVLVRWARLALRLEDYDSVIDAAIAAIDRHPLAEQLVDLAIRALYLAGRAAEALACYAAARERLAEELGTEPGPELRELHEAILRDDRDSVAPALAERTRPAGQPTERTAAARPIDGDTRPVPAQLPADVAAFSGRAVDLRRLDTLIPADGEWSAPVVISAIAGTAGVGKTTLAVHWAHRVVDRFPDGQLYVNLRGFSPTGAMVSPTEAMRGFLDALGVNPARIPPDLDAQAALYRSVLAGRRMLILLDNAREAAQVRPLLPGAPGCLVLVTSRDRLASLVAVEGAHPLTLDVLSVAEARQLLVRRLGKARVTAEPAAVDEIIERCARLPLALVIAAARAVVQPDTLLAELAGELRTARSEEPQTLRRALNAFDLRDAAADVRSVFSWSYRTLSEPAARLFRLLALHPGPEISVAAAASLTGVAVDPVSVWLTELARTNLIGESVPGRYTFHDLLRAYATELVHDVEAEADRRAVVRRVLDHYVHTAHTAAVLLFEQRESIEVAEPATGVTPEALTDGTVAAAWLTVEYPVLLAVVEQAAAEGFDRHVVQLAWGLDDFSDRRGHWHDRLAVLQAGLEAARRVGDRREQLRAHRALASVNARLSRYDEAERHARGCLELAITDADRFGEAVSHLTIGVVYERQSRYAEAVGHAQRALDLCRELDHRMGQARALNGVGWCHAQLGDYQRALHCCQEALVLNRELGDRYGEANTLDSIGMAYHNLARYPEAIDCYRAALDMFRAVGDRYLEADTLTNLGATHQAADDFGAAREAWQRAMSMLEELDHPDADLVRDRLRQLDEQPAHRL